VIKVYTNNRAAYQAYIKGHYLWRKRSPDSFRKAIEYFNQAIALDPKYALAYVGLSDSYALLSPNAMSTTNAEYFHAKAAVTKALELDDQLAEAHTSLANLTYLYEWNWVSAERSFRKAIELNPNYDTAHQWYGAFLSSMGRHDEAIAESKRALELDPLSLSAMRDLSRCFYHARRYDEAIAQYLRVLELEPRDYRLNNWLDMSYEKKGLYDKAIEVRLKAMEVMGLEPETVNAFRAAYAERGWQGYWTKEVEIAETSQKNGRYVTPPYTIARSYARLGEKDKAFAWLDQAYKNHADHLVLLKVDPLFDDMRADPRFETLLQRVGLKS
jgi:tetratricopeptide (TPR) repeat protein